MWAAFSLAVLYLAVLAAGVYEDGMNLFQFMAVFPDAMNKPFTLRWTPYTAKFILGALLLCGGVIALYYSSRMNRRPGEEHGSAKWGSVQELNKKYSDKDPARNVILTKHLCMSLNGRQHMRNLLQIVVGGSGAGKTRFVVKPNLLLANASFICTDPKGELVRAVAPFLLHQGYVVKVFDLIEPSHSDSYNPFRYIRKDSDVFRLISNFIQNTTPKNATQNDPFWEKSEIALDAALMLYLIHEAPPYEQTMEMMLTMIEYGGAKEDDDDYQSALDLLFEALEEEQPDHIAVRQYHIFKQAAGKTAKSILVSAAVRLASFTLREIQSITDEDTLELSKLGERKQAVFCVIPDSNDNSLNFLVGLLYTQAFQELYYQADKVHMGGLPVPVRLMFDEFSNVALPDGYARLQATMRSRNIMATIILQNISQLKALFKDDWEGIIGNADTMIYLGGNEQSTHEWISKAMGQETIDNRSYGTTHSWTSGSNSTNEQNSGRALMDVTEVRLKNKLLKGKIGSVIMILADERPIIDEKYDLNRHPRIKLSADGGAPQYSYVSSALLPETNTIQINETDVDEDEVDGMFTFDLQNVELN